jgi:hypothetical protein
LPRQCSSSWALFVASSRRTQAEEKRRGEDEEEKTTTTTTRWRRVERWTPCHDDFASVLAWTERRRWWRKWSLLDLDYKSSEDFPLVGCK